MVKGILKILHKDFNGLHEAAILLGLSSVLSQLLALIRDRLLASSFGASSQLDIYYSAFRIPDLVYVTIASFVSITVIVPFLIKKIEKDELAESKKFLSAVFSLFSLVMIVVVFALYFLMPYLSHLVAPGFSGDAKMKLVDLSRILLLSPFLLGLSNLFGGVTQTYKKFLLFSLSPILYNIGIISGIMFLYPIFGLTGLVWGVILGACLHLIIQLPFMIKIGFLPTLSFKVIKNNFKQLSEVVVISLPRTLALSVHQISLLVLVAMASYFGKGAIAVFNFSFNLQSVPLTIIGVSYSVAAFPTLSRLYSGGKIDKFLEQISTAGRHILFWSMPAMVMFIVLRAQVVRVILGSGHFDWSATRLTAACLALFAISVFAQCLILLFVRAYYAGGKTAKPLVVNGISSLLVIAMAFVFQKIFISFPVAQPFLEKIFRVEGLAGTEVLLLPLAFSVAMIFNVFALWFLFVRDFGRVGFMGRTFFQSLVASIIGGVVSYFSLTVFAGMFNINTFWGVFAQGFFAGLIGLFMISIILWFSKNNEIRELGSSLTKKIWKAETIMPEQEEL